MIAWIVLQKTFMLTAFVAVMMIAIEYINVLTQGRLIRAFKGYHRGHYFLAVLLGITPGCLGAFVIVALYTHQRISLGAVVAGMIATSGDEIFIMLALFPGTALLLTGGLALLGIVAGWVTDQVAGIKPNSIDKTKCYFDVHEKEQCGCFSKDELLRHWRPPSASRAMLTLGFAIYLLGLAAGEIGPLIWDWKRVILLLVYSIGLFIVSTVPDHFIDKHLWDHVIRKHVPRIFIWTLGALTIITLLEHFMDFKAIVADNRWMVLVVAALVGVIPESGPHLMFVTLFAEGVVPLSVLVASSAVQDGHGMLPLLAYSRRDFLKVKASNFLFGLLIGIALMAIGI